jgi:hypothetical protein
MTRQQNRFVDCLAICGGHAELTEAAMRSALLPVSTISSRSSRPGGERRMHHASNLAGM